MNRLLRRTWNRLLGSFRPNKDGDLGEEIESHLRMLVDEDVRRGIPPAEAYRRARLQFGSVESTRESYRDQRGLPILDALAQDLRYAFRGIRNNPGFATVAILSLAIGIGANTAIFSLVNGVLLQPLAYQDPQRLYSVRELISTFKLGATAVNPAHARAWAKECPSLEQVALMQGGRAEVIDGGEPLSAAAVRVPHDFFSLFGVTPLLGRTFLAQEELQGSSPVVVLSESLWRSRFAADPSLVGKSIRIDGEPHYVAGIVPASFRAPFGDTSAFNVRFEVFRPLILSSQELSRLMGNFNYAALVRVRRGASAEQALAEMNVVSARFARGRNLELKARLIPLHEMVTGQARLSLWTLAAAVGAVLLIVCINLANLLLSRIAARGRESAIRTALGASRGRQFAQAITESVVLAAAGGALGLLFAGWMIRLLLSTTTLDIPRLDEVRLDASVMAFAFCLTLVTGLLFGALPAWRQTKNDPQEALRSGSHTVTEGRRGLRLREGLISLEVGLSTALLIVAGLLSTSLSRLLDVDKGFDAGHVITVDLDLAGSRYLEPLNREKFLNGLLAKVRAIPGVVDSGVITALPTRGQTWLDPIYLMLNARQEDRHSVDNRYASPGYFGAMNIAVRQGRAFDESDRQRAVAVLSEKAAKILWPNESNPVGRIFIGEDDKPKTLVGIVRDVRTNLDRDPPATAYYPYWQRVPDSIAVVVRTRDSSAAGALRDAIRSEDAQMAIPPISTMNDVVDGAVTQRRFQMTLMAVFAVSALLVASLGIYGVVAYSVARRRNEIGIRLVLGAERSRLLALVLRQGMTPVLFGLVCGVAAALVLGRAIRGLLFGIQPTDPATIAGVTAVLLAVGVLACLIPARRAATINAVDALRFE